MTKPKYELGDIVCIIKTTSDSEKVPCEFCNAIGTLYTNNGVPRQCPVCSGKKVQSKWKTVSSVIENKAIVGINYSNETNSEGGILYAFSGADWGDFPEDDVFWNFRLADTEAKRRNELEQ